MSLGGDLVSLAQFEFGLKLLTAVVQRTPGQNVILSPLSLFQVLSLYALLGADPTRKTVRKALGIASIQDEFLRPMYQRFAKQMSPASADSELSQGTLLWLGKQFGNGATFPELARQWGISVFEDAQSSPSDVEAWVHEHTHGLLSRASSATPPTNGCLVLDAVYFKGQWELAFDKDNTQDRLFYPTGRFPKQLPLMRLPKTDGVQLYQGESFSAARIPYSRRSGRKIALHVFLPTVPTWKQLSRQDTLTPFLQHFSLNDWESSQLNHQTTFVDLMLPQCLFRQQHELLSLALVDMGFKLDFSATDPSVPALTKIQQQVYFAIDEKGTTASALTESMIILSPLHPPKRTPPPLQKFYVNRPFLFFLVEETTGLLLFAGAIHNPSPPPKLAPSGALPCAT